MSSITDFYTREKANAGIEIPLYLPDGSKSEHTLTICGVDSDAFRQAEAEANRKAHEAAADKKQFDVQDEQRKLLATLIIGWTFDEPLTEGSKLKFLREAPQIGDAIDQIASRRRFFTNSKPANSLHSPSPTSSSRRSRKDRKPA